VICGLY